MGAVDGRGGGAGGDGGAEVGSSDEELAHDVVRFLLGFEHFFGDAQDEPGKEGVPDHEPNGEDIGGDEEINGEIFGHVVGCHGREGVGKAFF